MSRRALARLPVVFIHALVVSAPLWLSVAALPAGGGSRAPHPPPTVYLEVDVLPTAVQIDVVGELQVWNTWLKLDVSGEYLLSDADIERIRSGAATFFATSNKFSIDGQVRQPLVTEVIPPTDFIPGRNIPNVRVRLRLPVEAEPRTVGFLWEVFEATDLFEKQALPAMVRYRGDVEQAVMTPAEPEYLWHTRAVLRRAPRVDEVTSVPSGWFVPLPSIVLLLTVVGSAVAAGRRRWPIKVTVPLLVTGVAAALALRHQGVVRLPGTGISIPGRDEAFSIFQRLHANIYRAFEVSNPEEIYDLLAVSVAPGLLDQMYSDVYESLVLRGQGGAVCKVDKIDVFEKAIETATTSPDGRPQFAVSCAWRVHGVVSHWGHEHRRLNQYRALYTVAHDGRAWRIDAVEVQEHSRIDENG